MPAYKGGLSVERLREAVAARVECASLRQAAREVGMSPTGLRKFLEGSSPYTPTRRKLERWYVREAAAHQGDVSHEAAVAALRVLVQDLPPARRRPAAEALLGALEHAYEGARLTAPEWLRALRQHLPEGIEPQ